MRARDPNKGAARAATMSFAPAQRVTGGAGAVGSLHVKRGTVELIYTIQESNENSGACLYLGVTDARNPGAGSNGQATPPGLPLAGCVT